MKTKFRTILKISLFSIAAIALLIFIIAINGYLKDEKLLFYATGTQYKVFLNSTWEMSEKEIERANDTHLTVRKEYVIDFRDVVPLPHFGNTSYGLKPSDFPNQSLSLDMPQFNWFKSNPRYPTVLNMSRYKGRLQNNITVFGYESQISYSFFDDKLFEYTLIIKESEADKLHKLIFDNISRKYGRGHVQEKKTYETQSLFWENTNLKVDYRLTEQSSSQFTAVVRFSYKPMFNKIRQEKLKEEKNLF